jgi:transposase-like protein
MDVPVYAGPHMPSPFEDDTAARALLERLRWPEGPQCPRCGGHKPDVFLIGGEKHSHREGLYQCKRCRRSFSVTVGTPLERLRIPLSTWVRAAHAFSYGPPRSRRWSEGDSKPTLLEIQHKLDVAYKTVLRMRDAIKQAAKKYRGYKYVFGPLPQSLMTHKREAADRTIEATGVLAEALPAGKYTSLELKRTERLLRLLVASRR